MWRRTSTNDVPPHASRRALGPALPPPAITDIPPVFHEHPPDQHHAAQLADLAETSPNNNSKNTKR